MNGSPVAAVCERYQRVITNKIFRNTRRVWELSHWFVIVSSYQFYVPYFNVHNSDHSIYYLFIKLPTIKKKSELLLKL